MPIIAEAEDDLIQAAALVLLVIIIALIVSAWLAWKKVSLPGWAYPDQIAGNTATAVDDAVLGVGLGGSSWKSGIDHVLGGFTSWIGDHLPAAPVSKLTPGNDGDPAEAQGGTSSGGFDPNQTDVPLTYQAGGEG